MGCGFTNVFNLPVVFWLLSKSLCMITDDKDMLLQKQPAASFPLLSEKSTLLTAEAAEKSLLLLICTVLDSFLRKPQKDVKIWSP